MVIEILNDVEENPLQLSSSNDVTHHQKRIIQPAHCFKAEGDGPWVHAPQPHPSDAEAAEEDDGDDGRDLEVEEEQVGPAAASRPTSKKEMNALRERFENTLHLCSYLYKDLALRDDLRLVVNAVRPYLREYSYVLEVLKESQDRF